MSKKDAPLEIYASVYAFLTDLGHTSAAKALLKDAKIASLDSKGATNLQEAFKSFSAKRPLVSSDGGSAKKAKVASSSSSDSSDSDSSEDEEQAKPVVKAPVAAKKEESSSSSSSSDSSSDSDSSDDEKAKPAAATKPAAVTKPVSAAKAKPAAPTSSSSDSSSDDSSDEESEVKAVPSKTTTPAKAQTGKAVATKKAESSSDDSSSSDSSSDSSEDEAPAKPATKSTPVAKAAPAAKPSKSKDSSSSSSDSSSDSSDDDEAPPAKKPATEKPTLVIPDSASKNSNPDSFKVYVRGLPWAATEKEVRDFFKTCGKIVSAELPLGEDGRASGTAFVKFSSQAEFNKAIELDGQYWPGTERWLSIKASSDKPEPKKFEVGVRPDGCNTVFVGNLPWDVTEEVMRETFSVAGEVANVRFAMNEDGSMKGFGHVEFCNGDDTVAAVKLAGTPINGRPCRVDYAPPRASSPRTGGGGRGGPSPRGGRGRGGGGRGGNAAPTFASKNKGSIVASSSAKKMTFDD